MASYTMQLRELVEHYTQDIDEMSHNERIEKAREKLFNFKYPIFDEKYKAVLETNFIRNFYMREIGFETEGLFKFQLETWLLINMPYYNKLFESELIEFDPLESYSLKTTYQRKNDTTQDETRNRLQNDDKTISQNDKTNNKLNETEIGSQNDLRTMNQNDRNTKNQNESRDVTQNDETTLKHDSNTITDTLNSNVETIQRESTSDTLSTTENNSERDTTGKVKDVDDNFSRNIEADTPDTRLELTLKDGEGALEYASKITENNQNNEKESTSETSETQKDNSESNSAVTSNEDGTVSNEGDSHLDTTVKSDDVGTLTSKIGDKFVADSTDILVSSVDDETTSRNTNQKNGVIDGTLESNINDKLTSQVDDTAKSVINNMEDYIENRVGSIGVKTYSEMINEYRSILLRIERDMFKEMNQLFMLVY